MSGNQNDFNHKITKEEQESNLPARQRALTFGSVVKKSNVPAKASTSPSTPVIIPTEKRSNTLSKVDEVKKTEPKIAVPLTVPPVPIAPKPLRKFSNGSTIPQVSNANETKTENSSQMVMTKLQTSGSPPKQNITSSSENCNDNKSAQNIEKNPELDEINESIKQELEIYSKLLKDENSRKTFRDNNLFIENSFKKNMQKRNDMMENIKPLKMQEYNEVREYPQRYQTLQNKQFQILAYFIETNNFQEFHKWFHHFNFDANIKDNFGNTLLYRAIDRPVSMFNPKIIVFLAERTNALIQYGAITITEFDESLMNRLSVINFDNIHSVFTQYQQQETIRILLKSKVAQGKNQEYIEQNPSAKEMVAAIEKKLRDNEIKMTNLPQTSKTIMENKIAMLVDRLRDIISRSKHVTSGVRKQLTQEVTTFFQQAPNHLNPLLLDETRKEILVYLQQEERNILKNISTITKESMEKDLPPKKTHDTQVAPPRPERALTPPSAPVDVTTNQINSIEAEIATCEKSKKDLFKTIDDEEKLLREKLGEQLNLLCQQGINKTQKSLDTQFAIKTLQYIADCFTKQKSLIEEKINLLKQSHDRKKQFFTQKRFIELVQFEILASLLHDGKTKELYFFIEQFKFNLNTKNAQDQTLLHVLAATDIEKVKLTDFEFLLSKIDCTVVDKSGKTAEHIFEARPPKDKSQLERFSKALTFFKKSQKEWKDFPETMHKTTQTQINNLVDELRQKLFAPNADFSKAAKISMGTFIDKTIEQILQNLDTRLSDAQKDEKEIIIKTEGEHLNRAISLIFEEISDKKKKGGLTEEVLSEIVDKHLPAPVVPKDKIGSIILSVKSTLINKSSSFNLKKMGSKSNLHEEQLSSSPPKFGSKLTKDSSS